MTYMDLPPEDPAPKRGDLVHTNVGDRRERTWFILSARRMRHDGPKRRFRLWMVRWWELEPELRVALWRRAERAGGQHLYHLKRYPARRKKSFEQYMKREVRA